MSPTQTDSGAPRRAALATRVRASLLARIWLSLAFGLFCTVVSTCDLFVPSWAPSFGRPTAVTLRTPLAPQIQTGADRLSYDHVRIIIPRGTVLTEAEGHHSMAFLLESPKRPPSPVSLLAHLGIYAGLGLLLTAYLDQFGQNRTRLVRTQIGLFILMGLVFLVAKAMLLFTALPEEWVPVGMAQLWVALSFDRKTAFLIGVLLSFVVASLLRFDIAWLTLLLVRGMLTSVLFFRLKRPRQMLSAGTLSGVTSAFLVMAIAVVLQGGFDPVYDLEQGLGSILLGCVGGGALGGLVALLFREPVERLLGHVSRDHLLELLDIEQPLLQKMAAEAPGSWEHARAMANLAEAAASAIGADALLTRAGAYYHDLGKTCSPKLFVENLLPGEVSPHEAKTPLDSARAIVQHVIEGTAILRDGGIPEPVVEFAYTHHGTQLVEYFWHKHEAAGSPGGFGEDDFRYPGMKPQTKETAILMIVDSIEAASRTVDPPERDKFEEMIQRVVFTKLKSGQLNESGLVVEDLYTIVGRMSDTLVNMSHSRIKYPWQREKERREREAAAAADAEKPGEQA